MSTFSKNLFDLLGDGDNEAPAAPAPAAAKPAAPAPAVKEQAATRPKSEKAKRGGKSDGRQTFSTFHLDYPHIQQSPPHTKEFHPFAVNIDSPMTYTAVSFNFLYVGCRHKLLFSIIFFSLVVFFPIATFYDLSPSILLLPCRLRPPYDHSCSL
jgi:hypothetical protein